MNDPLLPIPQARPPEPSTGEGAQTALAAMIRKRRMAENRADPDLLEPPPKPLPAA